MVIQGTILRLSPPTVDILTGTFRKMLLTVTSYFMDSQHVTPQAEHTTKHHLTHWTFCMPLVQTLVMCEGIMTSKFFPTQRADKLASIS
jgi:hypothetical protein